MSMVWQARLKRVIYANYARLCDFKSAEVAGLCPRPPDHIGGGGGGERNYLSISYMCTCNSKLCTQCIDILIGRLCGIEGGCMGRRGGGGGAACARSLNLP